MTDDPPDPIQIKMPEALDRRFARFDFTSDNSPRAPDNSIAINGSVAFNERIQRGKKDRTYKIGIKFAFLEISEVHCSFQRNMAMQEQLQEGVFAQSATSTQTDSVQLNASGEASARLRDSKSKATFETKAAAGYHVTRDDKEKRATQFEAYRVRWVASGCEFGDRKDGDLYASDGILRGIFLHGNWGRLVPVGSATRYGAEIKLLLPNGALSVTPDSPALSDRLPGSKRRQEAEGFAALKSAVAGWAVESELASKSHPSGFDRARDEIVLAFGRIAVDLSQLESESRAPKEASDKAVIAPKKKTPRLPIVNRDVSQTRSKSVRRIRK